MMSTATLRYLPAGLVTAISVDRSARMAAGVAVVCGAIWVIAAPPTPPSSPIQSGSWSLLPPAQASGQPGAAPAPIPSTTTTREILVPVAPLPPQLAPGAAVTPATRP